MEKLKETDPRLTYERLKKAVDFLSINRLNGYEVFYASDVYRMIKRMQDNDKKAEDAAKN